jgi:hypothetical protein
MIHQRIRRDGVDHGSLSKCTNQIEKLLCLVRQHRRRQLVERLESNFFSENAAEDDDTAPSALHKEACKFTLCDLGIRYPVLQAAVHLPATLIPHNST